MRKWYLILFTCIVLLNCFSSNTSSNDGGSGSEIVGDVEYAEGDSTEARSRAWPVKLGKIFIFRSDYEANTTIASKDYMPKTYTDNSGNFSIDSVKKGTWIIEANDNSGKAVTKKVTISTDDDIYNEGGFVVKKTSTLDCSIQTSLSPEIDFTYTVYVLGTRVYSTGNSSTLNFKLVDIPYGTYDIKFIFKTFNKEYVQIKQNVQFLPEMLKELNISFP